MYTMPKFSHANLRLGKYFLILLSMLTLVIKIFCLPTCAEAAINSSNSLPSHFSKLSRSRAPSINTSPCKGTPYEAACESILLSLNTKDALTPKELFAHSLQFSLRQAHSARDHLATIFLSKTYQKAQMTTHLAGGMRDCMELLDDTVDQLSNVIDRKNHDPTHTHNIDVQTWLSAALTNQETCKESLIIEINGGKTVRDLDITMIDSMCKNLSQFISNSLSLHVSNHNKLTGSDRKLLTDHNHNNHDFPSWVSLPERKLLGASIGDIEAHAVVAMDGNGTHRTIGEAIRQVAASLEGGSRNVIYVKAGTYRENLRIATKQKNVLLMGDGKGKTIIVGSKNAEDGSTTYDSATVGVMGDGFMARDITFVNSAGPSKHQAVALRVGSDRSVIFRCSILGYQDTLYTLSKRQFYRETDIYGTVDFIFGNSAVVFQNCNIYLRKPSSAQKNFVTAQGRSSPDQNTGISIQNCKIVAASDLSPVSKITYLGRPWKQYSTTVVMQSFLDASIHPSGWYPWAGGSSPKSVYYGEYMNSGPGAYTSGRVKWPGYHASLTSIQANKFTVGSFISGNAWLPPTRVAFQSGLR